MPEPLLHNPPERTPLPENILKMEDASERSKAIHDFVVKDREARKNPEKREEPKQEQPKEEVKEEPKKPEETKEENKESEVTELEQEKDLKQGEEVKKEPEGEKKEAEVTEVDFTPIDVKDYSEKNQISLEDAEKEIKDIEAVYKQHKGDPIEIAKVLALTQNYAENLRNTLEALQEKTQKSAKSKYEWNEEYVVSGGVKISKDEVIKNYRASYPNETEDKEDGEVYDLAKKLWELGLETKKEKTKSEIMKKARENKILMKSKLIHLDKDMRAEVEEILENEKPETLAGNYNLEAVVRYVKGGHAEKREKSAYEKGFKEGLEKGKKDIKIAEETPKASQGAIQGDTNKKAVSGLSAAEQKEAKRMFERDGRSQEQVFELYADFKKNVEERRKNRQKAS